MIIENTMTSSSVARYKVRANGIADITSRPPAGTAGRFYFMARSLTRASSFGPVPAAVGLGR